MDGPRYINSTEEYVKKLVKAMSKSSIKGRNISMDQLYTPISTAKWLLEKNITCVGTIMTSRIGLADELKVASAREGFESTLHWGKNDGDLSLCTYTTKSKSNRKKNVLVLSTMRPSRSHPRWWQVETSNNQIIRFYKGGNLYWGSEDFQVLLQVSIKQVAMLNFFYILDTIRFSLLFYQN